MSLRWSVGVLVCLANPVAPAALPAQIATPAVLTKGSVPPVKHPFAHHKQLHALYDGTSDSTHLSVVTHKGKYFLTIQRPRLTWTVAYVGQVPGPDVPGTVELEFRTQEPQVARDSRLVIVAADSQALRSPARARLATPARRRGATSCASQCPAPGWLRPSRATS
jgi:hypothetical protein